MFICYKLLQDKRFKYIEDGKLEPYSFTATISMLGQWYMIKIKFKRTTVTIQDSLKKLPFSVKAISGAFNLEMTKGEIDYDKERKRGYRPDDIELDYLYRDIGIVAQALDIQYKEGMTKMTAGAEALNEYKELNQKFRDNFPELSPEMDTFCRKSYKGGWVYVNPKYEGLELSAKVRDISTPLGQVLDVNSMYPWAMNDMPLPYGEPVYYSGEYIKDNDYPLYICHIFADFKLKDGFFPTIQLKGGYRKLAREYIIDSKGFVELWLTSVDLELLEQNYEIYGIEYMDGYKFRCTDSAFKSYISKWMRIKSESKGAMRTLAKLMLNSLYGKFAKNPDVTGRHPVLVDGKIRLKKGKVKTSPTNYVPVGCFITAWARWNIINSALKCGDRFIYADTDSLHILGMEPVKGLEVHESDLGKWKQELIFTRAKYLHSKCYIEEYFKFEDYDEDDCIRTSLKVTVSGMPEYLHHKVTFDNFKPGTTFTGKLTQKSVEGGVILKSGEFTIKDD